MKAFSQYQTMLLMFLLPTKILFYIFENVKLLHFNYFSTVFVIEVKSTFNETFYNPKRACSNTWEQTCGEARESFSLMLSRWQSKLKMTRKDIMHSMIRLWNNNKYWTFGWIQNCHSWYEFIEFHRCIVCMHAIVHILASFE